jgi:hypothetical protein
MSTRIHKQIAFTGDYSALKSMGYSFQKLFAGNYMQWELESQEHICSTRVWKKGAEVTIDELRNYEGFFFDALLKMKEAGSGLSVTDFGCIRYVMNKKTKEIFFDAEIIRLDKLARDDNFFADIAIQKAFPTPENLKARSGSPELKAWLIEQARLAADAGLAQVKPINKDLAAGLFDPKNLKPLMDFHELGWVRVREITITERNNS